MSSSSIPFWLRLNLELFPHSLVTQDGMEYALAQTATGPQLVVLADPARLSDFEGECSEIGREDPADRPVHSEKCRCICVPGFGWLAARFVGTAHLRRDG